MASWNLEKLKSLSKGDLVNVVMDGERLKFSSLTEVAELKNEVQQLKDQMSQLLSKMDALMNSCKESHAADISAAPGNLADSGSATFADVVKKSVQSVINDDKTKNEIVISKVDEGRDDHAFVVELCKKVNFEKTPNNITRLGRKKDGHHRPLRVTFSNPFDSRAFRARFAEHTKDKNSGLNNLQVRPCRNAAEQETYRKNKAVVQKLNNDAKQSGAPVNVSFSLRDNCAIWKFEKCDDGDWRRVRDWTYTPEDSEN